MQKDICFQKNSKWFEGGCLVRMQTIASSNETGLAGLSNNTLKNAKSKLLATCVRTTVNTSPSFLNCSQLSEKRIVSSFRSKSALFYLELWCPCQPWDASIMHLQ